jgi:Secretion system C-terminal sorting domain
MMPVKSNSIFFILLPKLRHLTLVQGMIFSFLLTAGQTNISGVVNSYYKVVEVIPAKACVRLNTVAGLARLQKVLLVQMKGASVVTTNNSNFGDTTSLNNAGNYEVSIICSINGDSVFMFHNFLNSYTIAGKVQLVKFAEYYSANVVDTVKASPWNNTTGTGGVIAISISVGLTLNAPVYADASGFEGGAYILSDGNCTNILPEALYYYDGALSSGHQSGSYKGESVYDFPASQSGGRGAPANGGGGGNNHNNSGGGGANLSAGGKGGGNSSTMGCTTDLYGEAGNALKNWGGRKIFFGGGGGAGHSDGSATISNGGGNGGGIVFIHAGTLTGNGYKISANGGTGGAAESDGASGGGAAGTIIVDVTTYSGSVTIQANGGKGGDENDVGTSKRCYGAGGGGSGGAIYFTGSIPAISISAAGGIAGLEYGSDAGCNPQLPAANGLTGSTISSYVIRQSTDSASYCLSIAPLPVRLIYFRAVAVQSTIKLDWRVANPGLIKEFWVEKRIAGNWSSLRKTETDILKENYNYIDEHPEPGINFYRLRIVENNNSFFYSPVQQVIMNMSPGWFVIHPNPATDQVTITGWFSLNTTISLLDVSGKLLLQKKLTAAGNSIRINLPPLGRGVYMLQTGSNVKKLFIR